MSQLEDRLRRASAAVRHAAENAVPEPISQEAGSMWKKPALAFAGALICVIVVIGAVGLLRDAPTAGPVAGPTTTTPIETTLPVDTTQLSETTLPAQVTTTSHVVIPECVAGEVEALPAQPGLPVLVAKMRDDIVAAAMACDGERLIELAGPDLVTSFGDGGPEALQESADGDGVMIRILAQILATPYAHRETVDGLEDYVWPSAFAYEAWDEIPEADVEGLRTFLSDDELDDIAEFGSYAYWRVGITPDGDWTFFVAGD